MIDKVIVTNKSALDALYGKESIKVIEAINQLIEADESKGIKSSLIFIDDKQQMLEFKAQPVKESSDEKQNKDVIDAVYNKIEPDYILLLGGPDIIPHQHLENPIKREKIIVKIAFPAIPVDVSHVPSDLPYACDSGYSSEVEDFLNPTRVVGRLAGVTGCEDPTGLIKSIKTAIECQPVDRKEYEDYFSISTRNPKPGLAQECLDNIFGNHNNLKISPPESYMGLNKEELQKKSHFIVCHGAPNFPLWIGEESFFYWLTKGRRNGEDRFAIALDPDNIINTIKPQTVAAAINCFGAQLYDPKKASQDYFEALQDKLKKIKLDPRDFRIEGICNTYMNNSAVAFCGSTSLAYEPGIIEEFFNNVLDGASIGRAFLQSRQTFVRLNPKLSRIELKTLAEFILLGDPSAHPIRKQKDSFMDSLFDIVKETKAEVNERKRRRQVLVENGKKIKENSTVARPNAKVQPGEKVKVKINELLKETSLEETEVESHTFEEGTDEQRKEKLHIVSGINFDKEHDLFPTIVKHIIHEKDDDVVSIKTKQSM